MEAESKSLLSLVTFNEQAEGHTSILTSSPNSLTGHQCSSSTNISLLR